MLFPVIKIKDGDHTHIVGTNSHDQLYVDEKTGGIQYLNLQCCEGTKKYSGDDDEYYDGESHDSEDDDDGEASMEFVAEQVEWEPYPLIKMVTIEELIAIAEENMIDQTEASLRLHASFAKYLKSKDICDEKRKGDDITDSTGMMF